ncbi:1100_t:CDS:1, partial [Gigaspora margarita]
DLNTLRGGEITESIRIIKNNYQKPKLIQVRATGKSLEKRNEFVLEKPQKYDTVIVSRPVVECQ